MSEASGIPANQALLTSPFNTALRTFWVGSGEGWNHLWSQTSKVYHIHPVTLLWLVNTLFELPVGEGV